MIATGHAEKVKLDSLLSSETVVPEMRATNRWEAIEELVDALVAAGRVAKENRDAVCGVVRARESSASTGIGHGIALPHAQTPFVEQVVAAFGRSREGMDFESLDGQPVKLVVLILIPQGQFQRHLSTLAGVARLLNDKKLRDDLEHARDRAAIMGLLRKKIG
jgi:mannitol/fructose-specific phosphotransferase system IIA component (Ntr-type)